MDITIHLGWWLAPMLVTVAACITGFVIEHRSNDHGIGGAVISIMLWSIVIIVSLAAWLVWALLT